MGNVFKGWRTKIGVVTLLIACAVMGGQIRSSIVQDTFTIGSASSIQIRIISVSHQLILANVSATGHGYPVADAWRSQLAKEDSWDLRIQCPHFGGATIEIPISSELCAAGDAEMRSATATCTVTWCRFPYWFLLTPLTLFSGYLLIAKPRKTNPLKVPERIPTH